MYKAYMGHAPLIRVAYSTYDSNSRDTFKDQTLVKLYRRLGGGGGGVNRWMDGRVPFRLLNLVPKNLIFA